MGIWWTCCNSRWKRYTKSGPIGTQTGFYNLTVVKDNIFDNVPGTFKGNADGFFVFLEPPSPGKHDLRLSTSVLNPTTPSYNYAAEVVYHLDIK